MTRSFLSFWSDAWDSAFHAATTVERRMSLMQQAAVRGDFLAEPELWRMVPEKVAAAAEGFGAASIAAAREMQKAAFQPAGLAGAGLTVFAAALGPAQSTCRANARRLGRKRRRR